MKNKRLVIVGGFLGAGKTTLIGKAVKRLQTSGLKCGVITNDQAHGLVDTALAYRLDGAKVSEIAGGCFCCNLTEFAGVISGQWGGPDDRIPDVIIAEPVGSCTDLIATVVLPLRKKYGESVAISPFSVVVDARRALLSLGGKRMPGDFSKNVGYIYRKQIEEAELVIINKRDLLASEELEDLLSLLEKEFPGKSSCVISAQTEEGIDDWLDTQMRLLASPASLMEVDYERYGDGEALLGWCNAEIAVEALEHPSDGDSFLKDFAEITSARLVAASVEIAHFKMTLVDEAGRLGALSQVMNSAAPEITRPFAGTFRQAGLTVNLRAEGDPKFLKETILQTMQSSRITGSNRLAILRVESFRPGQPTPVERVDTLDPAL